MSATPAQKVMISYEVPEANASWELEEENVPESAWHGAVIELLMLILRAWAARDALDSLIVSNLALRWNPTLWKVGVDPDVAVYLPSPPDGEDTASVCTWQPGHCPPRIAVEVVSPSTATKDYLTKPDQYAASGTTELWVFDPKLHGPQTHGGPVLLQLWRRDEAGVFQQLYRGEGPCRSPELGAWLVVTDGDTRLRLADDRDGQHLWPTAAERAESERERAIGRATSLEAELAAMRDELARLRRGG